MTATWTPPARGLEKCLADKARPHRKEAFFQPGLGAADVRFAAVPPAFDKAPPRKNKRVPPQGGTRLLFASKSKIWEKRRAVSEESEPGFAESFLLKRCLITGSFFKRQERCVKRWRRLSDILVSKTQNKINSIRKINYSMNSFRFYTKTR